MEFLQQALVYLAAAVIAVPIFNRLKLGSVLGYLVAGAVIGPAGMGLIDDVESVLHFSEFGVVLLLFIIGLELQPSRLWALRRRVFGLGGLQLGLSAPLLGLACCLFLGLPWSTALLVGAGLSLSSTAFALQLLGEKNKLGTPYGQSTFGILLFQDLAVIPLLAVLPFLGTTGSTASGPLWLGALRVVGTLAAVVAGKYVLRPALRLVAKQRSQELFTAAALLVVVGTALGVSAVGLSMALGAFLAGVLLADSEYRHELEADIEPFKGLLLGLFFIAVGMSINLHLVASRPQLVFGAVAGLVLIKAAVLVGIGGFSLRNRQQALFLGIIISQGGEFAFVLFRLSVGLGVLTQETADLLVAVVGVSMATTPILFALWESACKGAPKPKGEYDVSPTEQAEVIIAGFGRVGQVVGRVLSARGIGFTALDSDSEHIEFVRKFGASVYYGDASRIDLLTAAGAAKARLFVLAIDDPAASLHCAQSVLSHFPHLVMVARARNRQHAYRLMNMGIKYVVRETFAGSIDMTSRVLEEFGMPFSEIGRIIERFREHDAAMMERMHRHVDDNAKMQELALKHRGELQSLFEQDAVQDVAS